MEPTHVSQAHETQSTRLLDYGVEARAMAVILLGCPWCGVVWPVAPGETLSLNVACLSCWFCQRDLRIPPPYGVPVLLLNQSSWKHWRDTLLQVGTPTPARLASREQEWEAWRLFSMAGGALPCRSASPFPLSTSRIAQLDTLLHPVDVLRHQLGRPSYTGAQDGLSAFRRGPEGEGTPDTGVEPPAQLDSRPSQWLMDDR